MEASLRTHWLVVSSACVIVAVIAWMVGPEDGGRPLSPAALSDGSSPAAGHAAHPRLRHEPLTAASDVTALLVEAYTSPEPTAPLHAIRGRVTVAGSGVGLANVAISLIPDGWTLRRDGHAELASTAGFERCAERHALDEPPWCDYGATTTDSSGAFVLPTGRLDSAWQGATTEPQFDVPLLAVRTPGHASRLVALEPGVSEVDIALTPEAVIEGRITGESGVVPTDVKVEVEGLGPVSGVSNARSGLMRASRTTQPSATGDFTLDGLPGGAHRLVVTRNAGLLLRREITLREGTVSRCDIVVPEGRFVPVDVTCRGTAVEEATVVAYDPDTLSALCNRWGFRLDRHVSERVRLEYAQPWMVRGGDVETGAVLARRETDRHGDGSLTLPSDRGPAKIVVFSERHRLAIVTVPDEIAHPLRIDLRSHQRDTVRVLDARGEAISDVTFKAHLLEAVDLGLDAQLDTEPNGRGTFTIIGRDGAEAELRLASLDYS